MDLYNTRILEIIKSQWSQAQHLRVGVFRGEGDDARQIGEYLRNYSALFNTFFPFQQNGNDYALYSPHYTATRVMELPSCRDIGGEEPSGAGFFPTEFYVPYYVEPVRSALPSLRIYEPTQKQSDLPEFSPVQYCPFGFVAGCAWGDDTTWKIQYLDLAEAAQGIVRRDDRFGYIVLPEKLRLRDAVQMQDYGSEPSEEWSYHINIAVEQTFDLRTGTVVR